MAIPPLVQFYDSLMTYQRSLINPVVTNGSG